MGAVGDAGGVAEKKRKRKNALSRESPYADGNDIESSTGCNAFGGDSAVMPTAPAHGRGGCNTGGDAGDSSCDDDPGADGGGGSGAGGDAGGHTGVDAVGD